MNRLFVATACLLAGLAILCGPAFAQVSVSPVSPKAQDTLRVVVPQVFNDPASANQSTYNAVIPRSTLVSMTANKVTVSLLMGKSDIPAPASAAIDIPVGQFPAGTYEVLVTRREPSGASFGDVGSTTFVVSPRGESDPLWNHTDIWWDPAESGWGLSVLHHGSGKIFATWFVYGADRKATWFVVSDGTWEGSTTYRGTIYRTTGPDYATCTDASCPIPFNPGAVTREAVGTLVLGFHPNSATSASALFVIDGKTIRKSLQRQRF